MKPIKRPLLTYLSFWVVWKGVSILRNVFLAVSLLAAILYLWFFIVVGPSFYPLFLTLWVACFLISWTLDNSRECITKKAEGLREKAWECWSEKRRRRAALVGKFIQEISGQWVALHHQYPDLCEQEGPEVWTKHAVVVTKLHDRGIVVRTAKRGNKNRVHIEYPPKERDLVEDIVESLQRQYKDDTITISPISQKGRK